MLPIFTIRLHFTQKVVSESHILLHQNCLHIKKRLLKKFEKIMSRTFGATLISQNFMVTSNPLEIIFLKIKCTPGVHIILIK